MRDGEGRVIDFRNTVIMMTSNLGSEQIMAATEAVTEAVTQAATHAVTEAGEVVTTSMLMEAIRPLLVEMEWTPPSLRGGGHDGWPPEPNGINVPKWSCDTTT
jgi:AAA domain (Cdc48 subfamily)